MSSIEYFDAPDLDGTAVQMSEFVVVTADDCEDSASDEGTNESARVIGDLLRRVRSNMDMDIVFVAEFVEERRVFRYVDSSNESADLIESGFSDPLEETYCMRVVDGRLPLAIPDTSKNSEASELGVTDALNIQSYLSAAIRLPNGEIFGTLCCIGHNPSTALGSNEVSALKSIADLVSQHVTRSA